MLLCNECICARCNSNLPVIQSTSQKIGIFAIAFAPHFTSANATAAATALAGAPAPAPWPGGYSPRMAHLWTSLLS